MPNLSSVKNLVRMVMPKPAIRNIEKAYRTSRGLFWRTWYGFPANDMHVIAVTGTNGKTTTASYISSVLRAGGFKTAVYTTAYLEFDGVQTPNHSHMTVSSQADVQKFFAKAKKEGTDWVVLEVTSHALDQGRIDGVEVEIAVVTNLTQEHLDYHKTMEHYAASKAKLLGAAYKAKWCILNGDDKWFNFFNDRSGGKVLSFGESVQAELRMTGCDLSAHGSALTVRFQDEHIAFTTNLPGKFNAMNALAAYGVGIAAGLNKKQISAGIESLKAVPGRMEQVDDGQNFNVIVDYAITPDALQNVLTALKQITQGSVIIVFGATGDRDKTKRAPMGEVVGELADKIFLTDDETYTEDPESIRNQVYEGIKTVHAVEKTVVVDDRREAIRRALKVAKKNDTVLLTGIGHQDYRNMGGKKEVWDERQVALEELRKR